MPNTLKDAVIEAARKFMAAEVEHAEHVRSHFNDKNIMRWTMRNNELLDNHILAKLDLFEALAAYDKAEMPEPGTEAALLAGNPTLPTDGGAL